MVKSHKVSNNCTALGATFGAATLNIQFPGLVSTYTGYTITIDDTGGPTTAPDCLASEEKLLSGAVVVATTSDTCTDIIGTDWPCPFEDTGAPVDVVTVFEEIMTSSDDLLSSFLGTDSIEVSEALDDLLLDACGADGICTSQEMADYLQLMN